MLKSEPEPESNPEDEVLLNLQELLAIDDVKPEITLLVNGKPITFLCDTGACRTTCKEKIPNARPGSQNIAVRSANGKLTQVNESEPVWIRDPEGESCQLAILLLPECPVNLLGRDGLLQLGLGLVPTSTGQMAVKRRAELQKGDLFVVQATGQPNYYYSLDISNKAPHKTASALLEEGRKVISKVQDHRPEGELHVTLWFKKTPGPDREYEEKLHRATPSKVTVTYLYALPGSTAVAAVSLTEPLQKLHRMWTPPHVSLYKDKNEKWQDLGKIVQRGEEATDWVATSVNTWFSASAGLSKKALFWSIQVQGGTHLQPKEQ